MAAFIQNMARSTLMSTKSKKKAYGYYCSLCIKYNFSRLHRKHFKPHMILNIENAYKTKVRAEQFEQYREFMD